MKVFPFSKQKITELPVEIQLLIICTRLDTNADILSQMEALMLPGIQWSQVLSLSKQLGIHLLLYKHITNQHLKHYIPDEYYQILQKDYQRQALQFLYLKRQIQEIKESFTREKVDFCLIKGAELLETIYTNEPVRSMSDIDILCRSDDITSIQKTLSLLGYTQKPMHQSQLMETLATQQKHFPPFFHEKRHTIEIHFNLFSGLSMDETYTQDVWMTAVKDQPYTQYHLSKEHHLLYMCNHLAYHIFSPREGMVLYWFCDIFQWIHKYHDQIDWYFFTRLSNNKLKKRTFFILQLIHKELNAPIPSHILTQKNDQNDLTIATIISNSIGESDYQKKRNVFHYYQQIWFNKHSDWSFKTRLGYWFRLFYPQSDYLKERYQIKKPFLTPLYKFFHPIFMIVRAFRRMIG